MNVERYLKGKISFHYEQHPRWWSAGFSRYWSGRLIFINIGKFACHLDFRLNVMEDIITGKPA